MSATKKISAGDYNIITATTGNVNITTGNLNITGVGGTTYTALATNTSTTSSTLSNIGLSFTSVANAVYAISSTIFFQHSAATTNTHSFAVRFNGGTGNFLIQQQTTNVSVYSQATRTSNAEVATATTAEAGINRSAKITGTFTHTSAVPVNIQFSTSGGNLTVVPGSHIAVTRIA